MEIIHSSQVRPLALRLLELHVKGAQRVELRRVQAEGGTEPLQIEAMFETGRTSKYWIPERVDGE